MLSVKILMEQKCILNGIKNSKMGLKSLFNNGKVVNNVEMAKSSQGTRFSTLEGDTAHKSIYTSACGKKHVYK